MMRDRIVRGINECWQKRLLSEPDLTFKKAYKIILAAESADSNIKKLRMYRECILKRTFQQQVSKQCRAEEGRPQAPPAVEL